MTINSPPKLQCLVEESLISAPRINTHNQVSTLVPWCHKVRYWSKPLALQHQGLLENYFPKIPLVRSTDDNNLSSPCQPLLYTANVKLSKQTIALASRKIKPPENDANGEEINDAILPLPSFEKSYYLAEHLEVATGELVFSHVGFSLPGPFDFSWVCHFRSSVEDDFGLGPGWLHPLCERLWLKPSIEDASQMLVHYLSGDGRYIQFGQPSIGEACVNRNEGLILERLGAMNYRIISADRPDRIFRTDGANPWLPLVEIRDSVDNVLSIDYQDGRPYKIVSSWGRVVEIQYENNRLTQLSMSSNSNNPHLSRYDYAKDGLLTQAYDDQGRGEQYSYENGRLKQRRLAQGMQFTFTWNEALQRFDGVQRGEVQYHYRWRESLRKADISNCRGYRSSAQFDHANRLIQFRNTEGYTESWFYDSYGNLCSHTNALGQTVLYRWDKCGRCVRHTNAAGVSTHYRYNHSGSLVKVENSAGQTWRRNYSENGQLIAEEDPLGNTWRYAYSEKYLLVNIEDPEGSKTHLQWNSLSELEQLTTQEGNVIRLEYSVTGNLIGVQRAQAPLIEYDYNAENRLESVKLFGTETWKIKYDELGRILILGIPKGFAIACEYDALGRCKAIKFSQGEQRQFLFDAFDNCVSVASQGYSEVRQFNSLGWLISRETNASRVQQYEYNGIGQLVQHRDTAVVTHIDRNVHGQPTKITNNSGEICEYHYDELSRLVLAENRWGAVRFQYDLCGKLVAEHQEYESVEGRSFLHCYDLRGWHINTTSGDEHHLSYLLTPDGLLRGIDIDAEAIYRCDYDPRCRETEWVQGELKGKALRQSEQVEAIECTKDNEPTSIIRQEFSSEPPLLSFVLGVDSVSKRAARELCDARGNIIQEEVYSYTYDGWNNLVSAEGGEFKTYYRYDAFARRIAKTTTHRKSKNVRRSTFGWMSSNMWSESNSSPKGEDTFFYLRHPRHCALLALISANRVFHYLNTPGRQPFCLLSGSGEVLWYARYDEKGEYNGLERRPKVSSPWRALNAYYDIETQLYFVADTYYSPKLGVYLQTKFEA